jgi:hypothetical protein
MKKQNPPEATNKNNALNKLKFIAYNNPTAPHRVNGDELSFSKSSESLQKPIESIEFLFESSKLIVDRVLTLLFYKQQTYK